MKKVTTVAEMRAEIISWKREGLTVALVPTMGYFHDGHLSLMAKARELADKVVVSLFVNPTQFGPQEDLDAYPSDLERDSLLAEEKGVDVLFCPLKEEMYPQPFYSSVTVSNLTEGLCGASRPTHFQGVTTVVCKLLNLTQPDYACFGEKDFQQLAVIRQMVNDLNIGVEIIGCPIVREEDGLAMSSRNVYLSENDREAALSLSRSFRKATEVITNNGVNCASEDVLAVVRAFILSHPQNSIDYAKIVHRNTLVDQTRVDRDSMLVLAVKIGERPRLIDNFYLGAVVEES